MTASAMADSVFHSIFNSAESTLRRSNVLNFSLIFSSKSRLPPSFLVSLSFYNGDKYLEVS